MKRSLLFCLVLFFLFIPVAYCDVLDVEISPSDPEQGDVLSIDILADPDEDVSVSLDYEGDAPVSGGEYEIVLYDVLIPKKPNRFSAWVDGVVNLKVGVQYGSLPWITIQKLGDDGVASLSQNNIPTGTYNIKIRGDAEVGVDSVELRFSAEITLTMDEDGEYSYSYDTENIPPGSIEVDVGGETQTILLSENSGGGGGSSGGGGVAQSPVADFTVSGERINGYILSFDAEESLPVTGVITEYSWDFGDGSSGSGESISHIFAEPGEYAVKLTVLNSYGLDDSKTLSLVIDEEPNDLPIVSGGGTRTCLPEQVMVFRSQGVDPDGSIVSYLWSFGDGEIGEGRLIEHSWMNSGVYTVNHTVVDDRGGKASTFYIVTVEELNVDALFFNEVFVDSALFQYYGDLGASLTVSGNNSRLYFFQYDGVPNNASLPNGQIGDIFDLVVSDPDSVYWPIYVEIDYDSQEVDNVTETSLGIYYYQDGEWRRCLRTGVDVDRRLVWANLTRGELTGSPLTVGVVEPLPYFISTGLALAKPIVEEGEFVSAEFFVSNSGDTSGNFVSLLYLDEFPIASRSIHLDSGETKQITVSFNVEERGEHYVRLGDQVTSLTVTPPTIPDLFGTCFANITDVKPGDVVSVNYVLRNLGNRSASGFSCVLIVDDLKVSSMRVDNISPSENISWVYNWVAGVDGEYSFVFDVDVEKSVLETSEDNNSDILVIVSETPFPVLPVGGILAVIILLGLYVWRYGPIVRLNNENEDSV